MIIQTSWPPFLYQFWHFFVSNCNFMGLWQLSPFPSDIINFTFPFILDILNGLDIVIYIRFGFIVFYFICQTFFSYIQTCHVLSQSTFIKKHLTRNGQKQPVILAVYFAIKIMVVSNDNRAPQVELILCVCSSRTLTFQKGFVLFASISPLKMMTYPFYFILSALILLKVFKFLFCLFGYVEKKA